MTQQREQTLWTDEQHAAYELGMQTEREHQEALARLAMRKHADELAAAHAEVERLTQELSELRRGQYVPVEDGEYSAGKLLVHVLAGRYVIATKATHDDTGQDYWNATSLPNDYRLCRLAPQHNAAPDSKERDDAP